MKTSTAILIGDTVQRATDDQGRGEVFLSWEDGCVAVRWEDPTRSHMIFPQDKLKVVHRPTNLVFFRLQNGTTGRVLFPEKT